MENAVEISISYSIKFLRSQPQLEVLRLDHRARREARVDGVDLVPAVQGQVRPRPLHPLYVGL